MLHYLVLFQALCLITLMMVAVVGCCRKRRKSKKESHNVQGSADMELGSMGLDCGEEYEDIPDPITKKLDGHIGPANVDLESEEEYTDIPDVKPMSEAADMELGTISPNSGEEYEDIPDPITQKWTAATLSVIDATDHQVNTSREVVNAAYDEAFGEVDQSQSVHEELTGIRHDRRATQRTSLNEIQNKVSEETPHQDNIDDDLYEEYEEPTKMISQADTFQTEELYEELPAVDEYEAAVLAQKLEQKKRMRRKESPIHLDTIVLWREQPFILMYAESKPLNFRTWMQSKGIAMSTINKLEEESIIRVTDLLLMTEENIRDLRLTMGECNRLRAVVRELQPMK